MTGDVTQWLAEIRNLQRQLADTLKERDAAYKSAANWRQLYETEASQRRSTVEQIQENNRALQQELTRIKQQPALSHPQNAANLEQSIRQIEDPEDLRQQLIAALAQCDRLRQALETEQNEHTQTRQSLTLALGDAIDTLSKASAAPPASTIGKDGG
ncbi:MAG: hypothetical protein HC886_11780 [Leptolyngbyaceae cyanobacterium SM1_1_3]|nr:hypothetical protein [Leptolyngbyaceae cyanobacterium SM1_1_3]NJN01812.1 hypothetical protein [Leptolyngbyaceae cyanobacterium RM1_1_2]NJO10629.1 hypothetical protein [Leptolyngbyaceae cyanobacterium SL_1_1]